MLCRGGGWGRELRDARFAVLSSAARGRRAEERGRAEVWTVRRTAALLGTLFGVVTCVWIVARMRWDASDERDLDLAATGLGGAGAVEEHE